MKYYVLIISALLKLFYMKASTGSLLFILRPVNRIICLVTASRSVFSADKGYYNSDLNIIINKSCSGFNFMLICFVMTSFSIIPYAKNKGIKILIHPLLLCLSCLLTIFVNSSRILLSLAVGSIPFMSDLPFNKLHLVEGIFTYLFFLILIYLITDRLLPKRIQAHG